MSLKTKQIIIAVMSCVFLASLVMVQYREVTRKRIEAGLLPPHIAVPASSKRCVECHKHMTPGIIDHWEGSKHALRGVGCVDCHQAEPGDVDGWSHEGAHVAAIVTPRDCARCHVKEAEEFAVSHHSKGGDILASLDNFLAETIEGSRVAFNPHSPTPGKTVTQVNGMASSFSGCQQCHGSAVALKSTTGEMIHAGVLKPDAQGKPTNTQILDKIMRQENGKPVLHEGTWPNTGIGRINLDGSRGSCSACHSRHDFSPRRARQPENCGKCHLGPDHPQKEIYDESKHGVAYRDLRDKMNLDADSWVLGNDYTAAPTCATCHMSGHSKNGGRVTHDPGERISWTLRPPVSVPMDTDKQHKIVTEADPEKRRAAIADSADAKRARMKEVCANCHTPDYYNAFYKQYDDLVILYNEKFAKPGQAIIASLTEQGLITKTQFDEEVEWSWYLLWHHEGRRARHGASMMAPDYTHWHGMFEVAERFYMKLIPQAREITRHAAAAGKATQAAAVNRVIDGILARPEHAWFTQGAEADAERIRKAMEDRYGGTAPGPVRN
jgi:hypothetical protein